MVLRKNMRWVSNVLNNLLEFIYERHKIWFLLIDVKTLFSIPGLDIFDTCMIFAKLFQTLQYGEKYPCEVGKLPENMSKNRFKYIFPCKYRLKRMYD